MTAALLRELIAAQRAGRDVVLATRVGDGAQELLRPGSASALLCATSAENAGGALATTLATGEPGTLDTVEGTVFLRPYVRPPRLIIVGAVHIAQALAPMAEIAGFSVTIVDPREGFATAERFPGAILVREWPDRVLAGVDPDARTALVALTHDPKIDDPALIAALDSDAFYIGALGSRKTQAARRRRLAEHDFPEESLDRIHGPVGLPIGALKPEEIAVAVLAEVIGAMRSGTRASSRADTR